jgi:hypothetical protein
MAAGLFNPEATGTNSIPAAALDTPENRISTPKKHNAAIRNFLSGIRGGRQWKQLIKNSFLMGGKGIKDGLFQSSSGSDLYTTPDFSEEGDARESILNEGEIASEIKLSRAGPRVAELLAEVRVRRSSMFRRPAWLRVALSRWKSNHKLPRVFKRAASIP